MSQIREKHVVDGSTLQRDGFGQALLPEDIPLTKKTSQLVAYQSAGNGDCMFNTCSRLLVGDDSLSALELVTNKEYYAKHPKLEEFIHTNETRYSVSTLFSICLSRLGPSNLNGMEIRVMAIVEEAHGKLTHQRCIKQTKPK